MGEAPMEIDAVYGDKGKKGKHGKGKKGKDKGKRKHKGKHEGSPKFEGPLWSLRKVGTQAERLSIQEHRC